MKTRHFIFVVLATLPFCGHAQEPTLAEIIKQRGAVLEQIVANVEAQAKTGTSDGSEVYEAKVSLFNFRRETAADTKAKIEWQQKIVSLEQETKSDAEKSAAAGLAPPVIALRAEERLLAAKQKLLELKSADGH